MSQDGRSRDDAPSHGVARKIGGLRSLADDIEDHIADLQERIRLLSEERAFHIAAINDMKLSAREREQMMTEKLTITMSAVSELKQKLAALQADQRARHVDTHRLNEALKAAEADKAFLEDISKNLESSLRKKVSDSSDYASWAKNEIEKLSVALRERETQLSSLLAEREESALRYSKLEKSVREKSNFGEVARYKASLDSAALEEARRELKELKLAASQRETKIAQARNQEAQTRLSFEKELQQLRAGLLDKIRDLEIRLAAAQTREEQSRAREAQIHGRFMDEKQARKKADENHRSVLDELRSFETQLLQAQTRNGSLEHALREKREESARFEQRVQFLEFEKLVAAAETGNMKSEKPAEWIDSTTSTHPKSSRLEVVQTAQASVLRKIEPNG